MKKDLQQAIKILKEGGIVIFPTDTAFGIGCRIDDEEAMKRMFTLRKRPLTQATPILVSSREMAQRYLEPIPPDVAELMTTYWPGALTIRLPYKVEKAQYGGMRMPNHPTTLAMIEKVGVPIFGTSANFHGEPTPFAFEDLDPELVKLVDYVVPGECSVKVASTVIDCREKPWKILRQGVIHINV